jgi:hypothetical protein
MVHSRVATCSNAKSDGETTTDGFDGRYTVAEYHIWQTPEALCGALLHVKIYQYCLYSEIDIEHHVSL